MDSCTTTEQLDSNYIARLKELTEKLPPVPLWETTHPITIDIFDYGKDVFGIGIYKDENVGVQRAFLRKGSLLRNHVHQTETEVITVYLGSVKFIFDEFEKIVHQSESVYIKPGTAHTVEALEDCWCIGITIPPDKGYPDASR